MKTKLIVTISISLVALFYSQYSKGQGKEPKPPIAEQMMKKLDLNNDKKLSLEEFKNGVPEKFAKLDSNKNGFLSLEELKKDKQHRRKTAEQIMKDLDQNKDNKLSQSEAKGPVNDHFRAIDTSEDGFLSMDELKKFKPKEKPKR